VSTVSKVDKATAGDKSDTTESTTGKDTDNIQSGDQTGPDKPGAGDTLDTTESTTGKDTDNIQSGDQTGPDTGTGTGTGQNR
jgi:hypothetical protein